MKFGHFWINEKGPRQRERDGEMLSMKYGLICIGLSLVLIFLAIKSYETLTRSTELAPDKGSVKKTERKIESQPLPEIAKEPTTPKDYIPIAEKNIFNPERRDFPSGPGGGMKPLVRPSIILYGITIFGNSQFASISQPGRPLKKGERELMTLKVGEKIGEYRVAKVFPDRITLEAEGDSFEVFLYDSGMPKRRSDARTESKPASLTSTQPGPASPAEVPRPSQGSVQRPIEQAPERVITPPSVPTPARPSFPPPSTRRGGGLSYPYPGGSTQPGVPPSPGTSPQGTGSH